MKSCIFFALFSIVFAWKNESKTFDLRIFNLNQLLQQMPISEKCRAAIGDSERKCFGHHLMRYEAFEVKDLSDRSVVFTGDSSDEFDRRFCCEIWRWFDCTGSAITSQKSSSSTSNDFCTLEDYKKWWEWPDTDNQITYYCTAFQYGTYYCWYISLLTAILLAIAAFALISFIIIYCICTYRSKSSSHYYHRPRNPRPQRKEIRYNFPI